jgi:hypothetical protein
VPGSAGADGPAGDSLGGGAVTAGGGCSPGCAIGSGAAGGLLVRALQPSLRASRTAARRRAARRRCARLAAARAARLRFVADLEDARPLSRTAVVPGPRARRSNVAQRAAFERFAACVALRPSGDDVPATAAATDPHEHTATAAAIATSRRIRTTSGERTGPRG